MIDYRIGWFSFVMTDNAFFHVALSHVLADRTLSQRQGDPIDALRYRTESVRILNDRLEDQNDRISDGTIGTVAILADYEVYSTPSAR